MSSEKIRSYVDSAWDDAIVPALEDYIAIPALSPVFDPRWAETGHLEQAMGRIEEWCKGRGVKGLTTEIVRLEGRTPLLYMEVPGESDRTVLLYGHMDKQPPMDGWKEGLGAWTPVLRDGKLYGRGGADDGYAAFAAVTAIAALQRAETPHSRCVILIEATEESGSPDLPPYIEHLSDRIGVPELIVCLDSGAGNYDQLWLTASLRGLVAGALKVKILEEGVHSGGAGGIVPSSFRILRSLLSRIEDEETGEIKIASFHVPVPTDRLEQIRKAAKVVGTAVYQDQPFVPGARPLTADVEELMLNNTWRPTLAVVGGEGFPPVESAGNVLRAETVFKISIRIPPGVDGMRGTGEVKAILEKDPPYGAQVTFTPEAAGNGWAAPELASWLESALSEASETYFGKPPCYMGEGGSIPFMAMLGERYPLAQFMITGVLGPLSNAHGPNEFLHVAAGKKVTACVAHVLAAHARARG